MLIDSFTFNSFSTNDLKAAKTFYADILGLEVLENEMGILEIRATGSNKFVIYPKDNHKAATFTVLNFEVDNIEDEVVALIQKGIVFEQYKSPIKTDDKGICWPSEEQNRPIMAWFKDPAGNILSLIQE